MAMTKRLLLGSAALIVAGSAHLTHGQPASGVYQILSGRYTECCGIGGTTVHPLPYGSQGFVELTVDSQSQRARMRLLGQDRQTVFWISPLGPRPGFTFDLSNGMVFPDRIEFGGAFSPIGPDQAQFSYTVSNSANSLQISGSVALSCLNCADVPTQFKHTNVVANLLPTAPVIEGLQQEGALLRFRFIGEPPYDYFVEFSSSLTPTQWLSLTNYRAKLETIEAVVTDSLTNEPARFYRVRKEDCQCD